MKPDRQGLLSLTESLEFLCVATQPGGLPGTTDSSVGTMTLLSNTTTLSSCAGKSAHFSVLVYGIDDPVDAWIVPDLLVVRID